MPNNKIYFSYVLQNVHKKVYISNVIIFKNEQIFSKMIFLKQFKKIQLQLDVKNPRSIKLYTFETIFFAHNFRLHPNNKNVHFQWQRMNLQT
jgi:hypothetical protein